MADLVTHRRWTKAFFAVGVLVLLQITWWTSVFLTDVDRIAELRVKNAQMMAVAKGESPAVSTAEIEKSAFHRRVMFVSESVAFGLLTVIGFLLLYHALRAEERAYQVQKNFIEVVTHESKTPLTALKLRLESILEKWRGDEALQRDLSASLLEVRRLSSTFEKVLSLNRIERNAFHFETVDLTETVQTVLRRLDPLAKASHVDVVPVLEPECFVQGDFAALQSAVQSLLENAIYHQVRQDRRVDIRLYHTDDKIVLSVQDYGEAIPPEERAQVFERFFRGKKGRKVPGTGLGLSIAKQIAEAHQGFLRLAEGDQGNRFELELRGA